MSSLAGSQPDVQTLVLCVILGTSGSSKLKNAAKLGVRVISEAEFWKMVEK